MNRSYTLISPTVTNFVKYSNILICQLIGIPGIIGNILSVFVFSKQGYEESSNVTLTALAITDIGALLSYVVVSFIKVLKLTGLPIVEFDLVSLLGLNPHTYFMRVCGCITAFVAFERCVCVLVPLKVKQIITCKVALVFNVGVYVVMLPVMFPRYFIFYLSWITDPATNMTVLGATARVKPTDVSHISFIFTDQLIPLSTFAVIIICTVITGIQLQRIGRNRKSITSNQNLSTKEKKVVVMLVVVSVVFMVCLAPTSATLLAVSFVPSLSVYREYFDVTLILYELSFFTETLSSSVNVLVYYKMSSKYKLTVKSMLCVLCKGGTCRQNTRKKSYDPPGTVIE